MIDRKRRVDGKDGWIKGECMWSPTGYAWQKKAKDERDYAHCTCQPCKPPKNKKELREV